MPEHSRIGRTPQEASHSNMFKVEKDIEHEGDDSGTSHLAGMVREHSCVRRGGRGRGHQPSPL